HRRGDAGNVDPGMMTYPTTSTYGGWDPANTYDYFDALTRFYIQESYNTPSNYPADYLIDNISFYKSSYQENDVQVYSLTGTYRASDNRLVVTWNRDKAEDTVNQEVRYPFPDIHARGWAAATAAPNGITPPPGRGGYNNMVYDTTGLSLSGHSVVYIAIKPQNSNLFTEIAIPLGSSSSTPATPTVTATDAGGTYNGSSFPATATPTGPGGAAVSGTFAYTYYVGASASGTGSSTVPTNAGTYTVVATLTSSQPNYTNPQSATVPFTTAKATPTVTASDAGGTYNGNSFPASATATGVGGAAVSGSFAYTYYVGASASGTGSSTAPTNAG